MSESLAVSTYLYTKEAKESREQAEADLKVADPTPEHAIAVLKSGHPQPNEKASDDESSDREGVRE